MFNTIIAILAGLMFIGLVILGILDVNKELKKHDGK